MKGKKFKECSSIQITVLDWVFSIDLEALYSQKKGVIRNLF
jgi:hypothetical protein